MVGFFIVGLAGSMVFAECFLISSCFVDQDWPQLYSIEFCQVPCPLTLLRLIVGRRLDCFGCNDRLVYVLKWSRKYPNHYENDWDNS